MKISKETLRHIIKEELQEGLAASRLRAQSAQEIADALKQLEKVMITLLHQKRNSEPGTEEHDSARSHLQRIAAVAREYAYREEIK
jgi:hypothetical protein